MFLKIYLFTSLTNQLLLDSQPFIMCPDFSNEVMITSGQTQYADIFNRFIILSAIPNKTHNGIGYSHKLTNTVCPKKA